MAEDFYRGTGRRKEAVARVRIYPGSGEFAVNGVSLDTYFPNQRYRIEVLSALVQLDLKDSFDVVVKVEGGGMSGQAGALKLGIARALVESDESLRADLKKGGYLTRDARIKERKKYGLKGARKKPQFSKR
ncbi:MAG: 30S ribosomal protein S9 [Actinobacteria bacterium]|nr:30S ribosomal protein S9 [Actinomycetota bacterium]MCG2819667.1 30S ribosomal protein S9 [Actinomycetes bacterium]MBU4217367.1 30S ribosomal protein S9 [Actinomycetota bacterium]MBU4359929.1 30S ribosomal protein S9 [Actinomycetota bacterium]MBU4393127.1 30S ribosomal protein S9 [Actinomycetota bacterium]